MFYSYKLVGRAYYKVPTRFIGVSKWIDRQLEMNMSLNNKGGLLSQQQLLTHFLFPIY